jgi:hypothetical protein
VPRTQRITRWCAAEPGPTRRTRLIHGSRLCGAAQERCTASETRASAFSRHDLSELCNQFRAINQRARGMPGARCTRSRACSGGSTRVSHHRSTGKPGIPCAMVLTAYAELSPVTNSFLSPSSTDMVLPGPVGPPNPPPTWHQQRMPGPHGFAVRSRPRQRPRRAWYPSAEALAKADSAPFVCAPLIAHRSFANPPCDHSGAHDAAASTASHPNVRDDGQRPSGGRDGESYEGDLGWARRGIFLRRGLDRKISRQPVGQISTT